MSRINKKYGHFPSSASLRRGSSVFFKGFLLVNIRFGGNRTYFVTSYVNLFDKFPSLVFHCD